jgi:hypothetical protein
MLTYADVCGRTLTQDKFGQVVGEDGALLGRMLTYATLTYAGVCYVQVVSEDGALLGRMLTYATLSYADVCYLQVVGEDGALLGRLFVTAGDFSDEADACVIKQGQSAYVSIRQYTTVYTMYADGCADVC